MQYLYLCKVVLPLFHKHEAKIDTLASSGQVTNGFLFTICKYELLQAKAEKLLQQAVERSIEK